MKPIRILFACCVLLAAVVPCRATDIPPRLALSAAADTALSPYTGYTRAHWIEIAGRILAGVLPYFNPETGIPDFRGQDAESGHFQYTPNFTEESRNAFGRTLILASLYCAGSGLNTVPGYDGPVNGPYLKGLVRGTDPDDPCYFGPTEPFGAFGNQVAQAIMYCPQYFWDPLTQEQKDKVARWLAALTAGVGFECNCWYFNSAPTPVLLKYGYPFAYGHITEQMDRLLSWHSGDGFFVDGGNRAYDYYNFWGFQMFNLFHYKYTEPWKMKFGKQIRETTDQFMQSFPLYFGADGAPVAFGRSLMYRWAAVCPVGYAEAAGLGALDPGLERRIASGCLKYFWEGGALSENGLLQPGWLGPNTLAAEPYGHRGAPYWASVGFSPLLLPADHPFWTSLEKPMPADNEDRIRVVAGAQLVLKTNHRRGEARLFPIGSPRHNQVTWETSTKYYQHAYSSVLGWAGTGAAGPELAQGRSGVSLDGRTWAYRTQSAPIFISERHNADKYAADLGERGRAQVITQTLIGSQGEVHMVYHTFPKPLYIRVAGYGVSSPHGTAAAQEIRGDTLRLNTRSGYQSLLSVLSAPSGKLEMVEVTPREGWNHSHLFGGIGVFPQWTSRQPVPPKTPVVFYVDGARDETIEIPSFEVFRDRMEEGLWVRFEGVQNLLEVF